MRERDFCTWPVIHTELGLSVQMLFRSDAPWGDMGVCASWSFDEMATDKLCAQCPGSKVSRHIEGERGREQGRTDPAPPKGLFPTAVSLMRNLRVDVNRPR